MIGAVELNILMCNILNGKRYSNCRLCLKNIETDYVRLDDLVYLDTTAGEGIPLFEVLKTLLGEAGTDFTSEPPGIEGCCPSCADSALQAARFLESTRRSSEILNQIFDNLTDTLASDINVNNENQAMYIAIEGSSRNIFIVNKEPSNRKQDEGALECMHCKTIFEEFVDLRAHNLIVHNNFTCEKCFDIFLSESDLRVHAKYNHRYECTECFQHWDSEEGLQKHLDRLHNTHVCKECGKSYKGLDKLHAHEAKHLNKYVCPKCVKQYSTREFYDKHVNLCLVDKINPHPIRSEYDRNFVCEECNKSYSTPGGLRVHMRFAHENEKYHECKECGKKFTAPSYLKIHMIKHTGEKNFECAICKKRFVSKEALLYHTRRHTGEKPYSCKFCDERFVNASARAEHIKFRHIGPTLMCEICSRKFVTSLFLKQHISRHHDPSSKLYYGRNMIPPNMPGEENMRVKVEDDK